MSKKKRGFFARLAGAALPLGIVAIAVAIAWVFVATRPVPQRAPAQAISPQVKVKEVSIENVPLMINALGSVIPAKEIALKTRVNGYVKNISKELEPGHTVNMGHELLSIDAVDYDNDLKRAKASLAKSEADLALEMGRQTVAKNEFSQVNKLIPGMQVQDSALALRGPQLAQARAAVDIAKVEVAQAELNLKRTMLAAPFNALVTEVNVAPGHLASANESLAKLVGTDEYWISAAVPLDRLHQLGVYLTPEVTLPVKVFSSTGTQWNGTLLQSAGTLSDTSRMGRILVRVDDPLGLKTGSQDVPLLLGDQVRVEIEAKVLENVALIPRAALRAGNVVWVATKENKLDIRHVDVLWKDGDNVYIKAGLNAGDLLVVSDLAAPVPGQNIRPWREGRSESVPPAEIIRPEAGKQAETPGRPKLSEQGGRVQAGGEQ